MTSQQTTVFLAHGTPAGSVPSMPIARTWRGELGWIAAAAGLGFAVTAIFAGQFQLPRPWVVLVLACAVAGLAVAYSRWHGLDIPDLIRHRWVWATVRGFLLGAVLVLLALQRDPTAPDRGSALAFDLVWLGVVYGTFDALLLNVVPMMAAWRAFTDLGWTRNWRGRIGSGVLATAANLLVTVTYHLGYPEFREPAELAGPLTGNLMIGLGYVFAPNPLTAVISHIILHIAAVLAGTEGPVQLPPHY